MEVGFNSTEVMLCIRDNGKGFCYTTDGKNVHEKMKAGLSNMQIRSTWINGTMRIESEIGKGTTITVTAPLDTTQN
jgi:signal transduction histidine kinase